MLRINALFLSLFLTLSGNAQQDTILFELNGRASNRSIETTNSSGTTNPFAKFVGEWTLADDAWTQNWGDGTETITIKGHHTVSRVVNTEHTLLSIIDGPEPNGHIFWVYNPETREVNHASSFGTGRIGQGTGRISQQGDLSLKLTFTGEPAGTYRLYTYEWLNADEYVLKSVQMDREGKPTGLHYGGKFVRLRKTKPSLVTATKQEILEHGKQIRMAFAAGDAARIAKLHHPEVTKALGYDDLKVGREAVMEGIRGTLENYRLVFVRNEVESILVQGDVAIEQTSFSIRGTPREEGDPFVFSGRTQVTYVRYADSPTGWATIREIIQPAK